MFFVVFDNARLALDVAATATGLRRTDRVGARLKRRQTAFAVRAATLRKRKCTEISQMTRILGHSMRNHVTFS